ncbi:Teichoic acid translocation permease protein TagG [Pseudomonas fluorescens]|uniref:Transport permease protein n=1 Tax=Pseudomonas fluorescens TaxID=294 RepID=A0A5E7UVN3_PSEFL|nr:ABC transporter permease [Pseudomonas fluorescens]VVQ14246.1 Teichoic acid translocation permease protein TagG [Pseudomonas fluorescens]
MQHFSTSPIEMVASFWRNRALIAALTKREILGRYRGSSLGLFWSLFNPILMLGVYTFVFSVVFNARWGGHEEGSKTEYALVLFAGLIVFNVFSECVGRAPSLILTNVNYVKKVVFPLEVLPWVSMGAALFHSLISIVVWLVFYSVFFGVPHSTALFLPFVMLPLLMFSMGISWALASLGVYLRDITQVIGVVITMLMFLSGIFYSVSSLPTEYQQIMQMNPLVPIIEQARAVLIWGEWPNYLVLLGYSAGALTFSWLGFAWFQKTRKGFADVL